MFSLFNNFSGKPDQQTFASLLTDLQTMTDDKSLEVNQFEIQFSAINKIIILVVKVLQ